MPMAVRAREFPESVTPCGKCPSMANHDRPNLIPPPPPLAPLNEGCMMHPQSLPVWASPHGIGTVGPQPRVQGGGGRAFRAP